MLTLNLLFLEVNVNLLRKFQLNLKKNKLIISKMPKCMFLVRSSHSYLHLLQSTGRCSNSYLHLLQSTRRRFIHSNLHLVQSPSLQAWEAFKSLNQSHISLVLRHLTLLILPLSHKVISLFQNVSRLNQV